MPQRDRAAVHVHLVAVEAELLLDRQVLSRKRLVDLDQVDGLERQAGTRERFPRCRGGTHPHQHRLDAGRRPFHQAAHRPEAMTIDGVARRQDERGAAVDDAAGVARGDGSVLLECRRELREHVERGIGAHVVVAIDDRPAAGVGPLPARARV